MEHKISNTDDPKTVAIYFEEPSIKYLFAELLEVRGVRTKILEEVSELKEETKIITEPQFFEHLLQAAKSCCLLVGNDESLAGSAGITLSRPLTEDKIESAITRFLST